MSRAIVCKPPCPVLTGFLERVTHRTVHLVTARADARADGGDEIACRYAECGDGLNRRRRHPGNRASPTSVNGRHDAALPVREQDGHAIGDENRQPASGIERYKSVSLHTGRRLVARPHHKYCPAVHLLRADEVFSLEVQDLGKAVGIGSCHRPPKDEIARREGVAGP